MVADEVRTLAIRTQSSTSDIRTIIDSIQRQTERFISNLELCTGRGTHLLQSATRAEGKLGVISDDVQEISDSTTQIAAAIEQQSVVTNKVNETISSTGKIADETNVLVHSCMGAVVQLNEESKRLTDIASQYALKHDVI